jgi:hypothetical protein
MQGDWDIMRPRAETAGYEQSIFFNNAGASLRPRALVARVIEYLPLAEQAGGYEAADRARAAGERHPCLGNGRSHTGELVGVHPKCEAR